MRKIHPRLFHPTTCFILLFQSHSVILDMSFTSFQAQERHCWIRTNIDGQEQFGPIRAAISSYHLEKAKKHYKFVFIQWCYCCPVTSSGQKFAWCHSLSCDNSDLTSFNSEQGDLSFNLDPVDLQGHLFATSLVFAHL